MPTACARYVEDPSIGIDKVESRSSTPRTPCRCSAAATSRSRSSTARRSASACSTPRDRADDPFQRIHRRREYRGARSPEGPALARGGPPALHPRPQPVPRRMGAGSAHDRARGGAVLHPADRDQDHERGLGLATGTSEILERLELPQELHLEFLVRHNQVVRPHPGGLNPYHLGLKIWEDIDAALRRPEPRGARELHRSKGERTKQLFEVREADRDASFLRRFLTEELMRELDLFQYEPKGDDLVVSRGLRRGGLARSQGDADQERRHGRRAGHPDRRRRLRRQPRRSI